MLLDDSINDGQPKAGPLADLLGGVERFEELVQALFCNPRARIGNANQGISPRFRQAILRFRSLPDQHPLCGD